jgi:hypothetical protein
MLYPSSAWSSDRGFAHDSDQANALKILDETGGLSSMEEGRAELQRKAGRGARTLPSSAMQMVNMSSAGKWKNAGLRIAPDIAEEANKPGELKALARFDAGPMGGGHKKAATRNLRKPGTLRRLGGPGAHSKPSRWSEVLGAAKSADDNSQWNDLLAGVGFGDTMQRLSSYYQNNAILAGLLAAILFATMSGARLFDLERDTLSCPVEEGAAPCMLTKSTYSPKQLNITHYAF